MELIYAAIKMPLCWAAVFSEWQDVKCMCNINSDNWHWSFRGHDVKRFLTELRCLISSKDQVSQEGKLDFRAVHHRSKLSWLGHESAESIPTDSAG